MKRRLLIAGAVLAGLVLVGALVVVSGIVPVKASSGHWKITAWFLHFAMQRSVAVRSAGIDPPALDDERLVLLGAGHYEGGCRPCHGAPGSRLPVVPHHMTPHPPELSGRVPTYDDDELFYIVLHGIKMTGMPAWPALSRHDEVWAAVAFLRRLPEMDAAEYGRLVYGTNRAADVAKEAPTPVAYVCSRCHGIDGLGREHGAFPRLAAQRPEYLHHALIAYATGDRQSGIMQPIASELSDDQMLRAVQWYADRPAPKLLTNVAPSGRGRSIAHQGIPAQRVPPCAECHGPGDKPYHPAYPRLAGQFAEYLEQQLRLFDEGTRGGSKYVEVMKVAVHSLSPEQRREVARYYAALSAE